MKQFLNKLTNIANSKHFPHAQAQLAGFEKFLTSLDPQYVNGVKPYVKAAAYHFAYALSQPTTNDAQLAKDVQDMQEALKVTAELQKRLGDKTPLEKAQLDKAKDNTLKQYEAKRAALEDAIRNTQRRFSLQAMVEWNQETAKMLQGVFAEKDLPRFTPTPLVKGNKSSTKTNEATQKWSMKFLDMFNNLFKSIASGGDITEGFKGVVKGITGFVVNIISNFFFNTLGKDNPAVNKKIEEFTENAEGAMDRYLSNELEKDAKKKEVEIEREKKNVQKQQLAQFKDFRDQVKGFFNTFTNDNNAANFTASLDKLFKIK